MEINNHPKRIYKNESLQFAYAKDFFLTNLPHQKPSQFLSDALKAILKKR